MSSYSKTSGFTLVEIMIVVAIIGLLAAIAVPNFIQARNHASSVKCISLLRMVDSAKQQYAIEYNVNESTIPDEEVLMNYVKDHDTQGCPAGGTMSINAISALPTCSLAGETSGQTPRSHRLD